MADNVLARAKALLGARSDAKLLGTEKNNQQGVMNSALKVLQRPTRDLDVYITFDTTFSMQPYVDIVRKNIDLVTQELLNQGLRISVNGVSDHSCGETYLQMHALTTIPAEAKRVLEAIVVETRGNDDFPEAYECLALRLAERIPKESAGNRRAVVLIGDSFPHGMGYLIDRGCPFGVDYAQAFDAMKKMCDQFYFVGCDQDHYSFQRRLVSAEHERFVPLGSMVDTLPQLIIAMAKKTQSQKAYSNYMRQLEAQSPDQARKIAGLLT